MNETLSVYDLIPHEMIEETKALRESWLEYCKENNINPKDIFPQSIHIEGLDSEFTESVTLVGNNKAW